MFRNNEEGWRPGQDIAGEVLRPAPDGSGLPAGARIVALMDEAGWAERAAVPTQRIATLPDQVSFVHAATLPIAGLTALRTLRFGGRCSADGFWSLALLVGSGIWPFSSRLAPARGPRR